MFVHVLEFMSSWFFFKAFSKWFSLFEVVFTHAQWFTVVLGCLRFFRDASAYFKLFKSFSRLKYVFLITLFLVVQVASGRCR